MYHGAQSRNSSTGSLTATGLALAFLALGCGAHEPLASHALGTSIALGEHPPELLGVTVDGREIQSSEFKGRLVVLSFWATWCSPCLKELPRLERFHRVYGENALDVLAINFGENPKHVRRFLKKNPALTLPVVLDPRRLTSKRFGVKGIPTTVILDRTGAVRWGRVGYDDDYQEELISQLNLLVAEVQKVPGDSNAPVPVKPTAGR